MSYVLVESCVSSVFPNNAVTMEDLIRDKHIGERASNITASIYPSQNPFHYYAACRPASDLSALKRSSFCRAGYTAPPPFYPSARERASNPLPPHGRKLCVKRNAKSHGGTQFYEEVLAGRALTLLALPI